MELWVLFRDAVQPFELPGAQVDVDQLEDELRDGIAPDIGWKPISRASIWVVPFTGKLLRSLLEAVPDGDLVVWDESEQELLRREGGKVTVQPHGYKGLEALATA